MPDVEMGSLRLRVLWATFGLNLLFGAALFGVGGIAALGCTIGQGLSGVSTLALCSFIASASIIAGAVIALAYQALGIGQCN